MMLVWKCILSKKCATRTPKSRPPQIMRHFELHFITVLFVFSKSDTNINFSWVFIQKNKQNTQNAVCSQRHPGSLWPPCGAASWQIAWIVSSSLPWRAWHGALGTWSATTFLGKCCFVWKKWGLTWVDYVWPAKRSVLFFPWYEPGGFLMVLTDFD